jgi:hypothetical protein
MSPSDQIQDLFDRALSSVPVQPVPSTNALYERLSRHRVRTRFSTLLGVVGVTLFPRARQPRVYGGRLYPSLAMAALAMVAVVALVAGLVIVGTRTPDSIHFVRGTLLSIGGYECESVPLPLTGSHSQSSMRHRSRLLFAWSFAE